MEEQQTDAASNLVPKGAVIATNIAATQEVSQGVSASEVPTTADTATEAVGAGPPAKQRMRRHRQIHHQCQVTDHRSDTFSGREYNNLSLKVLNGNKEAKYSSQAVLHHRQSNLAPSGIRRLRH